MADRRLRQVLRGGVILSAVLPLAAGLPLAAVMLLLLPMAVECARAMLERPTITAAAGVLAVVCWLLLSRTAAVLAVSWCAACAAMVWRPEDLPVRRGTVWLGISVAALAAGLMLLRRHYAGDIFEGIAWDCVVWLAGRENGNVLLLSAYQAGFAALEGSMANVPAVNLFGSVIMLENVRLELMYSLRTTLTEVLTLLMPRLAVSWLGLTALLCAALPENIRRRQARPARLPAFEQWYLPKGYVGGVLLLLGGSLLPIMSEQRMPAILGEMCSAALGLLYTVLGLCTMEWLLKRRGTSPVARRLLMVVCLVLVPMIPVFLGVVDQAINLRRVRHSTDDEGGF